MGFVLNIFFFIGEISMFVKKIYVYVVSKFLF